MNDWVPQVSVISPERQALLDLIKLCKREMAQNRSRIAVLSGLANHGQSALVIQVTDAINAEAGTAQEDLDVLFRRIESDLMRGQAYLPALQELLSKHL